MTFKDFIKQITGITKVEKELKALEDAKKAYLNPKDVANTKKEPWVAVLNTNVNTENPRNGFFELDWNEYFIAMLRENGYTGGSDEEIVDAWFQDLCREIGKEEGVMMDRRFSGHVNINNIGGGKSEVS